MEPTAQPTPTTPAPQPQLTPQATVSPSSVKIDWDYQFTDSRAKVYLVWALLSFVGFVATHYYQNANINGVWALLSLMGLGYMYRVMPMKFKPMQRIMAVWIGVIVVGIAVSGVVAHATSPSIGQYVQYLGAFWLAIMGLGYALNGMVDEPAGWYYVAAVLNLATGAACYLVPEFTAAQYLVAAIVSAWSMLNLWVFRASYS